MSDVMELVESSAFPWDRCNVNSVRAVVGPYMFRVAPLPVGCKLVVYFTPEGEGQQRIATKVCDNMATAMERAEVWIRSRKDSHLWM